MSEAHRLYGSESKKEVDAIAQTGSVEHSVLDFDEAMDPRIVSAWINYLERNQEEYVRLIKGGDTGMIITSVRSKVLELMDIAKNVIHKQMDKAAALSGKQIPPINWDKYVQLLGPDHNILKLIRNSILAIAIDNIVAEIDATGFFSETGEEPTQKPEMRIPTLHRYELELRSNKTARNLANIIPTPLNISSPSLLAKYGTDEWTDELSLWIKSQITLMQYDAKLIGKPIVFEPNGLLEFSDKSSEPFELAKELFVDRPHILVPVPEAKEGIYTLRTYADMGESCLCQQEANEHLFKSRVPAIIIEIVTTQYLQDWAKKNNEDGKPITELLKFSKQLENASQSPKQAAEFIVGVNSTADTSTEIDIYEATNIIIGGLNTELNFTYGYCRAQEILATIQAMDSEELDAYTHLLENMLSGDRSIPIPRDLVDGLRDVFQIQTNPESFEILKKGIKDYLNFISALSEELKIEDERFHTPVEINLTGMYAMMSPLDMMDFFISATVEELNIQRGIPETQIKNVNIPTPLFRSHIDRLSRVFAATRADLHLLSSQNGAFRDRKALLTALADVRPQSLATGCPAAYSRSIGRVKAWYVSLYGRI